MALSEKAVTAFAGFQKNGAAPPPAASEPEAPAETGPSEAPAALSMTSTPRTRKPRTSAAPTGDAAKIAELVSSLVSMTADRDNLNVAIAECKAAIKEACG